MLLFLLIIHIIHNIRLFLTPFFLIIIMVVVVIVSVNLVSFFLLLGLGGEELVLILHRKGDYIFSFYVISLEDDAYFLFFLITGILNNLTIIYNRLLSPIIILLAIISIKGLRNTGIVLVTGMFLLLGHAFIRVPFFTNLPVLRGLEAFLIAFIFILFYTVQIILEILLDIFNFFGFLVLI